MTIEECKKRKREYKRMLDNLELLKVALMRSIAIENMNIADLKKNVGEQDAENNTEFVLPDDSWDEVAEQLKEGEHNEND